MVTNRDDEAKRLSQLLVGGQSGASLEIIRDPEGTPMVLKKPGTGGREKLLQQRDLLKELRLVPEFKDFVPAVSGERSDGSYLTDFFPGLKLGHWLQFSSPASIDLVAESLVRLLGSTPENLVSIDTERVERKVEELRAKFSKLNFPSTRLLWLTEKLEITSEFLLNPGIEIPEALPHGDFSFENILVSSDGSRIFLVDPNPSPIRSRFMDVARLRLDLVHGWWQNGLVESGQYRVNRLTLMTMLKPVWDEAPIVRVLTAFFALRIVPYTNNPMRLAYLCNSIDKDLGLGS